MQSFFLYFIGIPLSITNDNQLNGALGNYGRFPNFSSIKTFSYEDEILDADVYIIYAAIATASFPLQINGITVTGGGENNGFYTNVWCGYAKKGDRVASPLLTNLAWCKVFYLR